MEKIHFIRDDWYRYSAIADYEHSTSGLLILGTICAWFIQYDQKFDWVLDKDIATYGWNDGFLIKKNDKIFLSMDYFGDDFIFIVRQDLFLKLLETWVELYPLQLKRLNLTREGDKFTFDWDTGRGIQQLVIE